MMDADERRNRFQNLVLSEGKNVHDNDNDEYYVYKPRDDDIVIVGPPKSGTTWLQQIAHQLRTKGDESFRDIYDVTWWIPLPKLHVPFDINGDQPFSPRVLKHHECYGLIEKNDRQKTIVIIRDPHDAIYSWSKYMNGFFGGNEDITDENLAEMLQMFHDANAITSFPCIATWWPHRNDPNVLFLFYEDMKRDLETMIKLISNFLEIPLTKEELSRVVRMSSFEYMSQHKEKFKGYLVSEWLATVMGSEKWSPLCGMVRPEGGKIGDGKHNGPKAKAVVDKLWKEIVTEELGFDSYDDMYRKYTRFPQQS